MPNVKQQHECVRRLVIDSVVQLCKNGLHYNQEIKIEGVIAITVDTDLALAIHINEFYDYKDEMNVQNKSNSIGMDGMSQVSEVEELYNQCDTPGAVKTIKVEDTVNEDVSGAYSNSTTDMIGTDELKEEFPGGLGEHFSYDVTEQEALHVSGANNKSIFSGDDFAGHTAVNEQPVYTLSQNLPPATNIDDMRRNISPSKEVSLGNVSKL